MRLAQLVQLALKDSKVRLALKAFPVQLARLVQPEPLVRPEPLVLRVQPARKVILAQREQ